MIEIIKRGSRGRIGDNKHPMQEGAGYYIRGIDPELWRKVKTRAAHDGFTIRYVILILLKYYAVHGLALFLAPRERK